MEIETIFETVKATIADATGIDEAEIELNKTLVDDLEIDSIDLVDILFELESAYDIELKISKLEEASKQSMGEEPFEIDGVLTQAGIDALKKEMSEINHDLLVEGITVHELAKLFTVHSLCKLVQRQLAEKNDL